jgi:hypothetical protein
MAHQQLVGQPPPFGRQERLKIRFHRVRLRRAAEAEPARQPADVGVDRKGGLSSREMQRDHARGLRPDARERTQRVARSRDRSPMVSQQRAGCRDDRASLGSEEAARLDQLRDLRGSGPGIGLQGREPREERGGDQVDPAVGTLRREDHRNQELQIAPVVELDANRCVGAFEPVDDLPGAGTPAGE